ncbi:uncharacterized protein LOC134816552 [Bolinopsis microptera]|uniref:uncharacterized protein LOC134816552 n=1 Tax=Bolinopsis microptera TaxID=2820187 RepID=UPI003078D25F
MDYKYWRKVAELNNTQIAYTEIKYYESEKLFPVDLVLASDLIYDSEESDVDGVLSSISDALSRKPESKCWMAHQIRSSTHSVADNLVFWDLKARKIESSTSTGHDINIYELWRSIDHSAPC